MLQNTKLSKVVDACKVKGFGNGAECSNSAMMFLKDLNGSCWKRGQKEIRFRVGGRGKKK